MNERLRFAAPAWVALGLGCAIGAVARLATGQPIDWYAWPFLLGFAAAIWFVPEIVEYFAETRPRRKREKAIADFVDEMERKL